MANSKALSTEEIAEQIADLPGWEQSDDKITKEFEFENFRESVSFITRIAFEAEEQGHHPEIFNVYNSVTISLTTHDSGSKVTVKDIKLAKKIESLYNT